MKAPRPASTKTKWRDRPAFCLNNGVVQLTTLTGGGHIADFRLLDPTGSSVNSLWEPSWPTMNPDKFRGRDVRKYGPAPVAGKWNVYTIPLADIGVAKTKIYKFAIQDQTGLASNVFYVDDVAFVADPGRP